MKHPNIAMLNPGGFQRFPWKNGGGVTTDIAAAYRAGTQPGDWNGFLWRFGYTPITQPGPFSELPHIDRCQVVVEGSGLVLETPDGDIDLRQPLAPRRFAGETPITARLESGPVTVVNLLADRRDFAIALTVLRPDQRFALTSGVHVAYACQGDTILDIMAPVDIPRDHAVRFDLREVTVVTARESPIVIASIKAH